MAAAWLAAVILLPLGHLAGHRDDHVHTGFAIEYIAPPPASSHHVESAVPESAPVHSHEEHGSDDAPSHFGVLAFATVTIAPELQTGPSTVSIIEALRGEQISHVPAAKLGSRAPPFHLL